MDTILDSDLGPDGAEPQPRVIASTIKRLVAVLWDALLVAAPFFIHNVLRIRLIFPDEVFMIIAIVYRPYMEFAFGATLGKQWLKIEVVDAKFRKAGLWAVLLRHSVGIVAGAIVLVAMIARVATPVGIAIGAVALADAAAMLFDPQARALHDRLARTLVVETRTTI